MSATIVTAKFLPPTNTKGNRFSIRSAHFVRPIVVDYNHREDGGLSTERVAALLTAAMPDWNTVVESVTECGGPDNDLRYFFVKYTIA